MSLNKRKLFQIPVFGYILHFVDALFRLPRNDDRIKGLKRELQSLKESRQFASPEEPAMRVPAETVARVYNELLGRAPDRGEDIEGVTPIDFCLSVALSEERNARMTEAVMRDLAKKNEIQVAKTELGYMLTHVDDLAIGNWLRSSGAGDESDIEHALDLIAQVSRPVDKRLFSRSVRTSERMVCVP
jgi:hypothetical protein